MKKYTGHVEAWGKFVDAKVNAPLLLAKQLPRVARGNVILSSVTDPYQCIEARYGLTRNCLMALLEVDFPVQILTKSPLVVRDTDVIGQFSDIEVGMTITTDDDRIRHIFEPGAPSIKERFGALQALHDRGIRTYAFIGPLLPMNPAVLAKTLHGHVDRVLIDRMNYTSKTVGIYRSHHIEQWLDPGYVSGVIKELVKRLEDITIEVC